MSLHDAIMNIEPIIIHDSDKGVGNVSENRFVAYKQGHRDARHAAAQLSILLEKELNIYEDFILENNLKFDFVNWLKATYGKE